MENDSIKFKTHKFNISIEELENHESNGLDASWLKLLFSGSDINVKIINAIRRVSMNNIPTYAFPQELITIDTNTTVAFNNDYMRLRLSQLPVLGVDTNTYYLNEKYYEKINFADLKRPKHPNEKMVELYFNVHNNSANITNVTTDDCIVTVDGEQISPYSKEYPILLIKLRPNDRFKCHMKAVFGVGDKHVIWSGARNAFYDEITDKNTDEKNGFLCEFTIEGNQQCHEYEILIRACRYLIKKLTMLKEEMKSKITKKIILPEKIIHFKLDGEDHSIGEIINYQFQDHKNIISSGMGKPDQLIKSILIKITASSTVESPLDAMLESIDIVIAKYEHIGKLLEDMSSKKPKKTK